MRNNQIIFTWTICSKLQGALNRKLICHFKKTSKASDLTPIYHNIAYIHSQLKIHKEQIHSKSKPHKSYHCVLCICTVSEKLVLWNCDKVHCIRLSYKTMWFKTWYSYKSWLKFTPCIRLSQLVKWTLVSWLVLSLLLVLLRIPLVVLGTTGSLDCSSDCDHLWPPGRRITKQISLHHLLYLLK